MTLAEPRVGLLLAGVLSLPLFAATATPTPTAATPTPMPMIAPVESPPEPAAVAPAAAPVPEERALESETTAPVTRMTFAMSSLLKPDGIGFCPAFVSPMVRPFSRGGHGDDGGHGPLVAADGAVRDGGAYSGVFLGRLCAVEGLDEVIDPADAGHRPRQLAHEVLLGPRLHQDVVEVLGPGCAEVDEALVHLGGGQDPRVDERASLRREALERIVRDREAGAFPGRGLLHDGVGLGEQGRRRPR